ncbi:hypothetical protein BC332_34813 [Capsicum chinense]|nr:hypothetical protein BC332_34813 [Capsicum chinense]
MERLEHRGVTVEPEIDAQQIHVHYRNKRFKRIHWNCPFGEYPFNDDFSKVVPAFFQSSRQIQKCSDRIHITLMQEKTQHGPKFWQTRQKKKTIASGSHLAGYRLIKKRAFGERRYPGYQHRSTSGHHLLISDDAEMREFVFEKISFDEQCVLTKKHDIIQDSDGFFFECDTDYDSSTYEDSSDDETGSNS